MGVKLDDVLGKYADLGFSLCKHGDRMLELRFKEVVVAQFLTFSTSGVTKESIRECCRKWIEDCFDK